MEQYLNQGSQTKTTENIKEIANSFNEQGINLVFEILTWLHRNLRLETDQDIKKEVFRKRTAEEIIESKFATGCTDWALAFIVLSRAKEIPTKYIETIRRKWLEQGEDDLIEGHIFAEVYINNRWYIVDPEQAVIRDWYDRWIIFDKGLDSWDIGIHNFNELKEKFIKFREEYRKQKKSY